MAVITKGTTFANGDQVTAAKLNNLADDATFASGAVDNVSTQLSGGAIIVKDGGITFAKLASSALDAIYPVGSIYMNATNGTNPATLLGFGTWVAFGAGRVPVGIDSGDTDFDTAEETGGFKTHTLDEDEIPAHGHSITQRGIQGNSFDVLEAVSFQTGGTEGTITTADTGGGQAHNNLQP